MKLKKIDIFQRIPVSAIKGWYKKKQAADRLVISLLLVAAGLTILWIGLWRPVATWQMSEHERYKQARQTLLWITETEQVAREMVKENQEKGGQTPIIQAITSTASNVGIALARIQPESGQVVSVAMEQQDFNTILIWLDSLRNQHNVVIDRLAINGAGDGKVNFQGRLQR